jgi:hypothetical protein
MTKLSVSQYFSFETEYVKDLQIDTDFELLFSDEYINNVSERWVYNELGTVKKRRGIGSVPKQVDRPFWSNAVPKRW